MRGVWEVPVIEVGAGGGGLVKEAVCTLCLSVCLSVFLGQVCHLKCFCYSDGEALAVNESTGVEPHRLFLFWPS